jgi:DNA-binding transcriptional LysR family regulator
MARAIESSVANLEVFVRTYELGNFTRAAVALGLTPQAASRALGRLEDHLGATLFRRTTRNLEPTDAGRLYYAHCRQALDLLVRGERELSRGRGDEAGTIKISVGTTWAHHQFLPALAQFRREHPRINVEVQIDNRNVDFVRDGFDFAIRMGAVKDQSLVARKLGAFAVGVFASPAYLAQHPAPKTPAELAQHTCIGFVMPGSGRLLPWTFAGDIELVPAAELRVQGDVLGCVTLARAGAGLVHIYDFVVEREIARGELAEVLVNHRATSRPFSLLYPKGVVLSPAARALASFVTNIRLAPTRSS